MTLSFDKMCDVIQTVCSVLALVAAILIPEKIKWEQTYASLLSDYRGYDFAAAVQGIIDFFYDKCGNDIEKIEHKYKEFFKKEFTENTGTPTGDSKAKDSKTPTGVQENNPSDQKSYFENVSNDQNLHYQRRLLTQFYWQLYECAKTPWIGKRRVLKDFTKSEADILKIIFYMNKAIDEDKEAGEGILFKDFSVSDRVTNPVRLKGMNHYISSMYYLLKRAGRFME